MLFTRAFTDHLLKPKTVIAAAVTPGFCTSELRRNFSLATRIQARLMEISMGRTAEQGSRQLIWAALGPDGKEGPHVGHLSGGYVSSGSVVEPSDFVISKEGYDTQEKIWVSLS